jgi:hypothetical protein
MGVLKETNANHETEKESAMKITKRGNEFQIAGIGEETLVRMMSVLALEDRDPEIADLREQLLGSLPWKRVARNGWKGPLHKGLMEVGQFNQEMEKLHL